MASAGIPVVPSSTASTAAAPASGAAAVLLAGDAVPVDFAALLFAAQTPVLPAELTAELANLSGDGADTTEETTDGQAAADLSLLLGGLLGPITVPAVPMPANPGLSPAVAPEGTESQTQGGVPLLAATGEDVLTADLSAPDGKALMAANLAEPLPAAAAPGEGHPFGHLLGAAAPSPTTLPQGGAPTATVHVATAVHDAQWGQDFSQRIVWMARNEMQSAHLSLNPANLGPIEVTLNIGAEQATAIFSSPHGEVREALEAALPRLREMLAGAGIALGDAQVNAQSQRDMAHSGQSSGQRQPSSDQAAGAILGDDDAVNAQEGSRIRIGRGLVDTFA